MMMCSPKLPLLFSLPLALLALSPGALAAAAQPAPAAPAAPAAATAPPKATGPRERFEARSPSAGMATTAWWHVGRGRRAARR